MKEYPCESYKNLLNRNQYSSDRESEKRGKWKLSSLFVGVVDKNKNTALPAVSIKFIPSMFRRIPHIQSKIEFLYLKVGKIKSVPI